jgi:hypothetical protein
MTADPVTAPIGPRSPRPGLRGLARRQLLVPLLTVAVVGMFLAIHNSHGPHPTAALSPVPHSAAIEARDGIRVSQVAVTADGGMIDVRYIVLDPDRALAVGHSKQTFPVLIDDRSGRTLGGLAMSMWPHHMLVGRQYYLLYRNDGGTVQTGDTVSVKVGKLWLRHVVVR